MIISNAENVLLILIFHVSIYWYKPNAQKPAFSTDIDFTWK